MKKNELKEILKPLIKQCIKEVIFEEGVLSGIVSEVASGLNGKQLVETAPPPPQHDQPNEEAKKRLNEHKKGLLDAINKDAYNGVNVFEGTKPLSKGGTQNAPSPSSPMSGLDPGDPGVDISNIPGARNWSNFL